GVEIFLSLFLDGNAKTTSVKSQKVKKKKKIMEVDLTTSDDPPESHDLSQDDDTSLDHTLPLKLAHQLPETASCNEHCDQETPPEESATDNLHTDGKASGKTPCKMQQGAIFSGKILSFCCSECKDDTTYSPNDLLKHFQGTHKGTLPTYPCDLCLFVTNEFSSLQRHRIGHRNTLVTCEICNDGVQYSLLLLTRHFTNCHSRNGQFLCKKCEFSTRDAGTFVQHIHHHNERNHKCMKCPHGSPTQGEHQRHNMVHSGTFPFSCQICGYSAARRDYLNKHLTVAHGEEMNKWRANEDSSGVNSPGRLLKKSPPVGGSRETKRNSIAGVGLLDHNGRLFNPEKTLEETQQFLERAVGVKKESVKWTKSPLKSEPQILHLIPSTTPQPKLQEHEISPGSPGLLNSANNNGLTVLMVKNKISIPPNCTTKVMGFKMVDGKKHLVLKVIPTKQEDSTENEGSDSHIGDDEDKITSSPCSSSSPSIGSLLSLESGESNETSSIKEESQELSSTDSDLQMAQVDLSKYEARALASVMDEPSGSQSSADESTCPDAVSDLESNPEMSIEGKSTNTDILKSKLPSKATVDATFSGSWKNFIQEPSENSTEPNSTIKSPVEKSILDLEAKKEQDSDQVETLCKVTLRPLPQKLKRAFSFTKMLILTQVRLQPQTKIQEGVTCASENTAASVNSAAVLGKILEKHSDAIISQQLEKERMRSSATVQETVRPTKTTLRILQTPEGKQQMFLQTTDTPYAVPVQLKSGAGFKLITKSCSPKINVSYVKPGIEMASKTTGVALTLNGGRIGLSAQNSNLETKGQASAQMAPSGSGNRYFVNASALKTSLLLSGAVKSSSGEQATNVPQTCYLVQRPLPVTPVSSESSASSSKTVLATRPVLAMPVNAADKTSPLQAGRQAYLVRYISPAKSGILLNNSDGKTSNEAGKNRVFLKIVRGPNGTRFLSTAPYTTGKKSVYLATSSLQSPCLLMSSNESLTNVSAGLKTSTNSEGLIHKLIPASQLKHILPQSNVQIKSRADHDVALQKSPLVPCSIRPRSQRKRRRRALFEEMLESSSKMRRISSKSSAEKDATSIWEPVAKDMVRTLRLCPFSPLQEIKCPRQNQPVVVLNHPDADIPEVASIMRSVNRYKGEVLKVALSQDTVKALSEFPRTLAKQNASNGSGGERSRPVGGAVQERFILKLKLKKTSRNKYEVVRSSSAGSEQQSTFCCWFCGRVFNNQEDWIGHGQRHLMEATRDWNKLF
uniref:Si:ch211-214e3.5 n=1 Tax=Cyprinus carpio carpio TaxID=630221 RepID=A0A9J8BXW7_CYPCA